MFLLQRSWLFFCLALMLWQVTNPSRILDCISLGTPFLSETPYFCIFFVLLVVACQVSSLKRKLANEHLQICWHSMLYTIQWCFTTYFWSKVLGFSTWIFLTFSFTDVPSHSLISQQCPASSWSPSVTSISHRCFSPKSIKSPKSYHSSFGYMQEVSHAMWFDYSIFCVFFYQRFEQKTGVHKLFGAFSL